MYIGTLVSIMGLLMSMRLLASSLTQALKVFFSILKGKAKQIGLT